jgi:hypothetical protein
MDAPFVEPAGKAVWYSFGTLVANAAARVLQVDPGELEVGVRPVKRPNRSIHGEVFLYDDVPGGAGYARAIEANLQEILERALQMGEECSNPSCGGACYHCMYDYSNQMLHPILDRELGAAMLRYILRGEEPKLDRGRAAMGANALAEYAREAWQVKPGVRVGGRDFACVLEDKTGQKVGLWVIHPLMARPSVGERQALLAQSGMRSAVHTTFDLEKRPFWVLNNLVRA